MTCEYVTRLSHLDGCLFNVRALMTMQQWDARIQAINVAIESGNIEHSSRAELVKFNTWLCHSNAGMYFSKNYVQVCETVRLHLLRSMIDAFEERSKIIQWWLIFFAVLAIVATLLPYFISPNPTNPYKQSSTESILKTGEASLPPQTQSIAAPIKVPPSQRLSGTAQKRGAP